jgi:hypothetical protein
MFRRETIIALRARHQAYRVASDILYPHVDAQPPPEPGMPLMTPDNSIRYETRPPLRDRIANALFVPLVVIATLLAWVTFVIVLQAWTR